MKCTLAVRSIYHACVHWCRRTIGQLQLHKHIRMHNVQQCDADAEECACLNRSQRLVSFFFLSFSSQLHSVSYAMQCICNQTCVIRLNNVANKCGFMTFRDWNLLQLMYIAVQRAHVRQTQHRVIRFALRSLRILPSVDNWQLDIHTRKQ